MIKGYETEQAEFDARTEAAEVYPGEKLEAFLRELTELSYRFGLGITGKPELFVMESGPDGDFDRRYSLTEAEELEFA